MSPCAKLNDPWAHPLSWWIITWLILLLPPTCHGFYNQQNSMMIPPLEEHATWTSSVGTTTSPQLSLMKLPWSKLSPIHFRQWLQCVRRNEMLLPPSNFLVHVKASQLNASKNNDDKVVSHTVDIFFSRRELLLDIFDDVFYVWFGTKLADWLGTPNQGYGTGMDMSLSAVKLGAIAVLPFILMQTILEQIYKKYANVSLQDTYDASRRRVLIWIGGKFRPIRAVIISTVIGIFAGWGEELLFRGVLQYEVARRFGIWTGVLSTGILFGLLHTFTTFYVFVATISSMYMGMLYLCTNNLMIPIVCHAIHDIVAFLWIHWRVSQLTEDEKMALLHSDGSTSPSK